MWIHSLKLLKLCLSVCGVMRSVMSLRDEFLHVRVHSYRAALYARSAGKRALNKHICTCIQFFYKYLSNLSSLKTYHPTLHFTMFTPLVTGPVHSGTFSSPRSLNTTIYI